MSKINDVATNLKEQAVKEVFGIFQEFFTKYPFVTAAGWTQYTPSFNDGEPCTFSINGFYFFTQDNPYTGSVDSGYYHDFREVNPPIRNFFNDLMTEPDLFYFAFGDSTKVVVTPNGMESESYESGQ